MVEVILPSTLVGVTGTIHLSVNAYTVRDLIKCLIGTYGEEIERKLYDQDGEWIRFWQIFVNGVNVRFLNYFETKLNDEDKVALLPVVDGG